MTTDRHMLDLAAVERAWAKCDRCRLATGTVVQWRGTPGTGLILVGEGPGAEEHRTGEPFRGKAGALLDRLGAEALGGPLDEHAIIVNIVGCRPPKNRAPRADEVRACRPRLDELIAAAKPRGALVMGATALRWFGGRTVSLSEVRGETFDTVRRVAEGAVYGESVVEIPTVATWHPAFLLRNHGRRRAELEDEFRADLRAAATLGGEWL